MRSFCVCRAHVRTARGIAACFVHVTTSRRREVSICPAIRNARSALPRRSSGPSSTFVYFRADDIDISRPERPGAVNDIGYGFGRHEVGHRVRQFFDHPKNPLLKVPATKGNHLPRPNPIRLPFVLDGHRLPVRWAEHPIVVNGVPYVTTSSNSAPYLVSTPHRLSSSPVSGPMLPSGF